MYQHTLQTIIKREGRTATRPTIEDDARNSKQLYSIL